MCRRCIIKGRAVGKSTEVGDDYNKSLKVVLEHDKCVAIIEVKGQKVAAVNLTKAQATEIRNGKYPNVSMSCSTPGKTVKEIPLGKLSEKARAALGMGAHSYIRERLREVTDPKNRPPLELMSRQALGAAAKDPVPQGRLSPIYDAGCAHPIAWRDSEGGMYGRDGKKLYAGKRDKCPPDATTFCAEACPKCGHCSHCCDCCTCGEDDDDGPSLPHKTWCPKADE